MSVMPPAQLQSDCSKLVTMFRSDAIRPQKPERLSAKPVGQHVDKYVNPAGHMPGRRSDRIDIRGIEYSLEYIVWQEQTKLPGAYRIAQNEVGLDDKAQPSLHHLCQEITIAGLHDRGGREFAPHAIWRPVQPVSSAPKPVTQLRCIWLGAVVLSRNSRSFHDDEGGI